VARKLGSSLGTRRLTAQPNVPHQITLVVPTGHTVLSNTMVENQYEVLQIRSCSPRN